MSDELWVSGGGRITIAPEDVLLAREAATRLRLDVAAVAERLEYLLARVAAALPAGNAVGEVLPGVGSLGADVTALADRLGALAAALNGSMVAYSLADRAAASLLAAAADRVLYDAGLLAPFLLALAASPAGLASLALILRRASGQGEQRADLRRLLSDRRFVGLVRLLAGSVDDGLRGALHVPFGVSEVLDDGTTGWFGRSAVALGLVGAVALATGERPGAGGITLQRTARPATAPPAGVADALSRVPRGPSQIRIERYPLASGASRFYVYVEGTVDLGVGTDQPFDMGSNVEEMGGLPDADAQEAVVEAMRDAGIGTGDEVELVGHSQGALVASRIAASGEFPVAGLITAGNPGGDITVPDGVAVLAVVHDEDLMPALSGPVGPLPEGQVTVSRSIYDDGPPPGEEMFPAHGLDRYEETGRLIDASGEETLTHVRTRLFAEDTVGPGITAEWRATRR